MIRRRVDVAFVSLYRKPVIKFYYIPSLVDSRYRLVRVGISVKLPRCIVGHDESIIILSFFRQLNGKLIGIFSRFASCRTRHIDVKNTDTAVVRVLDYSRDKRKSEFHLLAFGADKAVPQSVSLLDQISKRVVSLHFGIPRTLIFIKRSTLLSFHFLAGAQIVLIYSVGNAETEYT